MEYTHPLIAQAIQAGKSLDCDGFWHRIREEGTPLVEPIEGSDEFWVTFVHQLSDEDAYAVVAGLSPLPADSVMSGVEGTDIAYFATRMKRDRRVNYSFVPGLPLIDPQNCTEEERESFGKHLQEHPPTQDPYSRVRVEWKEGGAPSFMSVLELPDAPDQSICVKRQGIQRGWLENHEFHSKQLGDSRPVTVYTPPGFDRANRYALLVVFDGGAYLTRIPGHRILDNLIAEGDIPPVVAAFVNPATDRPDARTDELMLGDEYAEFITTEFMDWMTDTYGVSRDPSRNVLAGSSAGGVASAYIAFKRPDLFGNVLSQSGAYWVGPGYRQSRRMNADFERQWLVSRFEQTPTLPLRFYLDVGQYEAEDTMVSSNRRLKSVLESKGYPMFYQEFAGGHDYACWRGTFADGLRFLLGER